MHAHKLKVAVPAGGARPGQRDFKYVIDLSPPKAVRPHFLPAVLKPSAPRYGVFASFDRRGL